MQWDVHKEYPLFTYLLLNSFVISLSVEQTSLVYVSSLVNNICVCSALKEPKFYITKVIRDR